MTNKEQIAGAACSGDQFPLATQLQALMISFLPFLIADTRVKTINTVPVKLQSTKCTTETSEFKFNYISCPGTRNIGNIMVSSHLVQISYPHLTIVASPKESLHFAVSKRNM